MHIVDLMTPLVGGLGGGVEGTAIVTVASHILGVVCYNGSLSLHGAYELAMVAQHRSYGIVDLILGRASLGP